MSAEISEMRARLQALRDKAKRARELAWRLTDAEAEANLNAYAGELEGEAELLAVQIAALEAPSAAPSPQNSAAALTTDKSADATEASPATPNKDES